MSVSQQTQRFLTDAQIEEFITRGHITLHNCFGREIAKQLTDRAFVRLGYDPADPTTWREERVNMGTVDRLDVREFAPTVWQAACELLGGEDRIQQPYTWSDGFIGNFGIGKDRPWEPPSADSPGWHKDGDFFRHFLDSPEQGLLTLVVWTDIAPRGGGTFLACDSVPVVARFLAEHPEGVLPGGFDFKAMIRECRDFVEFTGEVGDVVLLHPFILHTTSQNHSGKARFITNPPIHLREPMRFDRDDPAAFSPIERAVLRGLGVERLDFRPTHPRERVETEGVRRRRLRSEEEKARLAAAAR
jgi:hypothetical protein